MKIALPLEQNSKNAKISVIADAKAWALIEPKSGDMEIFQTKEEIKNRADYIVIKDKNEDIEEFLDEGIDILIAPFQESVEDIVEAYMFKELYELGS